MLVLRTALCAREPATINTVTELLGLDFDRMVHTVLRPLLPILHGSNAGELGMTLYISFASYLTDPQRSGKFYCEVQRDNELLVQLCFKAIAGASPPFNVCRLESSYLLDREVPDVDERVDESISQAMWYACRHWATHLMLAGHSDDLLTALYEFLSTRLLLWMEVMNLKHQISQAAELLGGLHAWLHEIECPVYIRDLVLDAWKFVEAYSSSVVSASTPHIYISALLFWPVHRPVSIRCIPALQYVTKVTGTRLGRRREDIMVLTGSDTGVVRSPQVLETTPRETIDNIEPSRTGPRQSVSQSFEGHTYKVLSVAYSPDGANVASGSGEHTVRIWDTHTCQSTCQPLNGHTSGIYSVAYSPNGAYIASGSEDKTIRIWDAHTGKPVGHPLEGHTRTVNSVAYSPDGAYIVSGSDDRTVLIWNAHTCKLVVQLFDNYTDMVRSIAYSPDGAYIAAGSDDKTIRIWAPLTRQLAGQPLKGHKGPVRSVAYSPDGAYIVSGSVDMTVRIWNAHTLRPVGQPLEGHTDWVLSVVYSPDGAFIASGSWDKTVRIWDAHTGKAVGQPLVGHTGGVYSVAYSPNGAYIVSGSHDNTLRVWDSHAGHAVQLPEALLQPTWSNPRPPKHSPFPSAFARYVTHISKKPIPAINSSHKITAENLVHRWALDDQGWVVNACQKRLVWVPQDLRELVLIPPTLAIMPLGDRVILDFRDAKLGTEWDNCFDSRQIVFNESN
ncbi:hypothetical protein FS749_008242 [Ceratobasidium sp. UAMH 11750]|nr:hypothetical protein FS749_008242 [Ceratobasidium sp. UAMH 11750]